MDDSNWLFTSTFNDVDQDGYTSELSSWICVNENQIPYYQSLDLDCFDRNPQVHPYATGSADPIPLEDRPEGLLDFDYNCDGLEIREIPPLDYTTCTVNRSETGCEGFSRSPNLMCGERTLYTDCSFDHLNESCFALSETYTQVCH